MPVAGPPVHIFRTTCGPPEACRALRCGECELAPSRWSAANWLHGRGAVSEGGTQ